MMPKPDVVVEAKPIDVERLEEMFRTLRTFSRELAESGYEDGARTMAHVARAAEVRWRRARRRAERAAARTWESCRTCKVSLVFRPTPPGQSPALTCPSCGVLSHICCELPMTSRRVVEFAVAGGTPPCGCGCHDVPLP